MKAHVDDDPGAPVREAGTSEAGEEIRAKLEGKRGRELWRSLEELAGTPAFEEMVRREYPSQLHKFMDPPQRREFLKLMGASLALAGIGSSCTRQPKETIVPYAKYPESTIPGKPLWFATSMPWPRGAIGLLVESHEGRPTKVEGNPEHPASLGATDAMAQASVLGLYDPDRSQTIKHRGRISTWDAFLTELKSALDAQAAKRGTGLRILTETMTSPTLRELIHSVLELYPGARWYSWEPVNRDRAQMGAVLALEHHVGCQHRFDRADVIVSLDADFLGGGPESVEATRAFVGRRRVHEGATAMSRLYVLESAPTLTGASADHRLALGPSDLVDFARLLMLSVDGSDSSTRIEIDRLRSAVGDERSALLGRWAAAITNDLRAHPGASLVVAGESQPPLVHAIAHAVNDRLGNAGRTVSYTAVENEDLARYGSITSLVADMKAGTVDALVILQGNPVLTAPADLDFAGAMARVLFRVHLSLHEDETSNLSDWHVNEAHFLESWGDALAADGTAGIVQPLIAPLYGGKTAIEMVAALAGRVGVSGHELVREYWRRNHAEPGFEAWWRRALHDGLVRGPAPVSLTLRAKHLDSLPPAGPRGLELVFRPDPTIWDGRFANNGWLQELPKPITKLTWDNAAQVSPRTAEKLDVENEDVVELELDGRKVRAPIWIVPGQADDTVVVHLGYGRTRGGRLAEGAGFDAYKLRTTKAMWSAPGLKVTKTGEKRKLSTTQEHDRMEGRDIVRVGTIDRFREDPKTFHLVGAEAKQAGAHGSNREGVGGETAAGAFVQSAVGAGADHGNLSMHPPHPKGEHSWGMVIDLNACTACGACVTACQAENNIPIVGREEVRRGRELHWIRVDRYFEGAKENPAIHHQPIPCMHCENAPCEVVCPVGATVHNDEGLNEMAYNRCVGTRYCGNNCPYKVRRFNFFLYSDFKTEVSKLQRNPDVTVRSRGVMEKCTYCVQRINEAKIQAHKEDRKVRDGEVRTACQQVCPAEAIVFGDIDDPASAVARMRAEPHRYGLLEELNTRPRTTYLAKVRNPNPELEG